LTGNGAGPTAEHLRRLHSTHLADETAGRKYVARLEELSGPLTGKGARR
jgi:hypothetical protein